MKVGSDDSLDRRRDSKISEDKKSEFNSFSHKGKL